jgi:hypothetical protein
MPAKGRPVGCGLGLTAAAALTLPSVSIVGSQSAAVIGTQAVGFRKRYAAFTPDTTKVRRPCRNVSWALAWGSGSAKD